MTGRERERGRGRNRVVYCEWEEMKWDDGQRGREGEEQGWRLSTTPALVTIFCDRSVKLDSDVAITRSFVSGVYIIFSIPSVCFVRLPGHYHCTLFR